MAGAGLATELVNTGPGVWHGDDQLPDVAALRAFLDEHGVAAAPTTGDLTAVRDLRSRLRAVLDLRDAASLADGAADLVAPGLGTVGLVPDERGRPQWSARPRPDAGLADRLALLAGVGVLGALRTLGPERFRDCASDTCSGVFIDTSRPGRRRYCMPDLCGNRANVAAYRARQKAGGN
ncbi:CGNR zinc finger domain-containing protein [Actinomycetospora sp. NBRC 106375]|uniref:CGNR zinc finger domain-containing protein n=1 Tax=Actinomycetospora sp. NBRC 106375 TaxID=3032207 RepID=UPI002554325B|nr:CGNR zinc finger domain-containing protein [Actinomycetospora sp. NBRC 106375]